MFIRLICVISVLFFSHHPQQSPRLINIPNFSENRAQFINSNLSNGTQMTRIVQMFADLISANPPNQRNTAGRAQVRVLFFSHHPQNLPRRLNPINLLKNQPQLPILLAQNRLGWIGLYKIQHLAECRALEVSRVGL